MCSLLTFLMVSWSSSMRLSSHVPRPLKGGCVRGAIRELLVEKHGQEIRAHFVRVCCESCEGDKECLSSPPPPKTLYTL